MNVIIKLVVAAVAFCSSALVCVAQSSSFNPKNSLENISISQWTTDDGLPSNNTNSVFQDSHGLIWIASNNGLMVYDGERIETYDKNRLAFLDNDGFYNVAEDHNKTIFIASKGDGLIQYKKGKFKTYKSAGAEIPKSVRSVFVASDSSMYLGSNSQGLYRVKNDTAVKLTDESYDPYIIQTIIEDGDQNIWFGTEGQGLNQIKDDQIRNFDMSTGLLSNDVFSLSYHEGKIFIGTSKGLQWMDEELMLHEAVSLQDIYVNSLLIDDWGMIWVGSEGGVARWNPKSDQLEWLKSKHNIDLVRINSLIKDKEDQVWLSSNRSGLIQIKESKVSNLAKPTLSSNRINIIHESRDGNLYIGTDANQLDVYDGKRFRALPIRTDLKGNGVRDIFHDRDGSLWLATYIGIIHMHNGTEQLYSTTEGMPADNFRTIHKDQQGYFWFGTRSGGLVQFKDGQIIRVFGNGQGLESNFVFSIAEADTGEIYVGTFGGGLTVIDQNGDSRTYHLGEDDSGLLLFNIDFDENGLAFVTTNNGLVYFENEQLKEVVLRSEQRSCTFFDLIIDDKDHMWLTTNLGVLQFKKSDWELYRTNQMEAIPYFIVDESSGMNTEECTGATRSTKVQNGSIYVPTLGGLVVIDPDTFKRDRYLPKVCIRHMMADDQSMNIYEGMVNCKPGTSRYRFDFSVLSYISPERNQYRYKLEGFDADWSHTTYDGAVEYTNLSPGDYTFKVIGTNDGSVWNTEGDMLQFKVEPFYYQTTWFMGLCISIVILTIVLFYTWRVAFINNQNRELKKVNAELDRFVYSASHEMRSPLSSILGLINVATMDKSPNKDEYLDYIKLSVQRLDALLKDIVDHSKNARLEVVVEKIDVKQQAEEILQDISYLENYAKIKHSITSPEDLAFYSDAKRLKIVMSNLITNAFKHHAPDDIAEAYVNIDIKMVENQLQIIISDNGPGIPDEEQGKIFNMFYRATHKSEGTGLGLYLVKEIIENLKGTIALDSKPNEGTTFTIEIPDLRGAVAF